MGQGISVWTRKAGKAPRCEPLSAQTWSNENCAIP